MRKYSLSIIIHIIILLLLVYPFVEVHNKHRLYDQAVLVDFTDMDQLRLDKVNEAPKRSPAKIKSPKAVKNNSSKKAEKAEKAEPNPEKVNRSKPVNSEIETKKETVVQSIPLTSKVVEDAARPVSASEDVLKAEAEDHLKEEKRSFFKDLFKKAGEVEQVQNDQPANSSMENTGPSVQANEGASGGNAIGGALQSRKVLSIPVIKDDSQKEGRVVIKICVGPDGKVISSDYTQVGSTTNDSYLVKIAEEGADQYVFSPADIDRQCGRVIINFQLK